MSRNQDLPHILQAIMDNTYAQLAYLDREFNFILVNAAYAKSAGHSREDLIGRNYFDLFPSADNQAIFERVRDSGERAEFFAKEFVYTDRPKRGVAFWNWSCVPVKDAAGQVQGLVLSLLDVTETVRAQQEVLVYPAREGTSLYLRDIQARKREQEVNAQLATIVESSEDAIIGITSDGVISNWNPAAERLFGYSGTEIIGKLLSILYPPDHTDEFPQIMEQLKRGERIDHFETHRIRKDGQQLDVAVNFSPIKDSAGKVIGAAKIARDITAQKRAREAEHFLAEASAVLTSSLDYEATLPSVARLGLPFLADYCIIDILQEDGSLRRVATAAASPPRQELLASLMARYPTDAGAMGARQVVQSGLPRVMWEMLDQVSAEVVDEPELGRFLRDLAPSSYMIVPMVARGRTLGAISLLLAEGRRRYDVTDLVVAEDLARRAAYAVDNARLYYESQAAVRARDQFLTLASHEVRTPLTVILGYTQLLRQQVEQSQLSPGSTTALDYPKLLRGLRNVEYSASRLEALMSDLLDITRLTSGPLSISPGRMNLSESVVGVVESVRGQKQHQRRSSHLSLKLELTDGEVWGYWDRVRIEQVITNLVDNAVKYSPPGGVIRIRLAVEPGAGDLQVSCAHLVVGDEGIGIPPSELGKIFQPFVRATNAVERQYPGLGIGLAVSKEIINRHGGRIWVESKGAEQGSTFHVVLPLNGP